MSPKQNDFSDKSGATHRSTLNTISGKWAENRGHRFADESMVNDENPFENGEVENWNHRQGWDRHFLKKNFRGMRNHGGALIGHDLGHAGKGPRGYTRLDESIYEDVCEALYLSPEVDASNIEVSVTDGSVYLKGSVKGRETKRRAELEIEHISGVKDVQNLLTLEL